MKRPEPVNQKHFTELRGEKLLSLELVASFHPLREARMLFEVANSNDRSLASSLVRTLLESKLITSTSLRSLLSKKGRAGRPRVKVDDGTGSVQGMKEPNKSYIEGWNRGASVEEIASTGFLTRKRAVTPTQRSKKISDIRRILRRNSHLLTRPYGPIIKKKRRP